MSKKTKFFAFILSTILLAAALAGCAAPDTPVSGTNIPIVKLNNETIIQYLGHSAFVLTAKDGTALGIDLYKKGKAPYAEDVPQTIEFAPDSILTKIIMSHKHADHSFVPKGTAQLSDLKLRTPVPIGTATTITPYRTEHFKDSKKPGADEINSSYLINMDGMKILHLGDAQGTMTDIAKLKALKEQVGDIHLLIMPIGDGKIGKLDTAVCLNTIDILNPKAVIPVHYWKNKDKEDFLNEVKALGYSAETIEKSFKVISVKDMEKIKARTIWSMTPEKY